jgi:EAL domain-containing protein (putative c-di-GMP-specific phosphodiesterase class I)
VNLSGHSIGNSEVPYFSVGTFDGSRLLPRKICFEVAETVAITRMSSTVPFIRALRREGFHFALDDFGSGLSSFGYLKNLPVDYLKIDGVFVKHPETDAVDRTVVRCINNVARARDKQTIAEYVENARILGHLREIGVDYAQGYPISPPRRVEELDAEILHPLRGESIFVLIPTQVVSEETPNKGRTPGGVRDWSSNARGGLAATSTLLADGTSQHRLVTSGIALTPFVSPPEH